MWGGVGTLFPQLWWIAICKIFKYSSIRQFCTFAIYYYLNRWIAIHQNAQMQSLQYLTFLFQIYGLLNNKNQVYFIKQCYVIVISIKSYTFQPQLFSSLIHKVLAAPHEPLDWLLDTKAEGHQSWTDDEHPEWPDSLGEANPQQWCSSELCY